MRQLAICGAAAVTILAGGSYLASPARAAAEFGVCTLRLAIEAQNTADANCQRAGYTRGYITEMSCDEDGNMTFSYMCA